jgi:hypothetical protein
MDFSDNDNFLEMNTMKVTSDHIRDYNEGEDIFVVWDIVNNQIFSDYD